MVFFYDLAVNSFWISLLALGLGVFLGWRPAGGFVEVEESEALVERNAVDAQLDLEEANYDFRQTTLADSIRGAMTSDELVALYEKFETSDEFKNSPALVGLMCKRWVEIDPQGGVDYFKRTENVDQISAIFAEWVSKDMAGALEKMDSINPSKSDSIRCKVMGRLLDRGNHDLCLNYRRASGVYGGGSNEQWRNLAENRTDQLAELILNQAREDEAAGDQITVSRLLEILSGVMATRNPETALEWAVSLSGEVQKEALNGVMRKWVENDPKAVAARLTEWEEAGNEPKWVRDMSFLTYGLIRSLAEKDFEAAVRRVDSRDGRSGLDDLGEVAASKLKTGEASMSSIYQQISKIEDPHSYKREEVFKGLFSQLHREDLIEAGEFLIGLQDSELKIAATSSLLKRLIDRDPKCAAEIVSRMPDGETRDQTIGLMMTGIQSTFGHRDFFNALAPEARAVAASALYGAEPELAYSFNFAPLFPGTVAEGLAEAPDSSERREAIRRVGLHWGAHDPQGALDWARDLSGPDQTAAIFEVTKGWAEQDTASVAHQLNEMPEGSERDLMAAGLVSVASQYNPEAAWLWGETISDEKLGTEARKSAFEGWTKVDREAAGEALETAELRNSEREALRAILEQ